MQTPGTALLVEDDARIADTLRGHLTRAGFVVYEASGERDAIRRVQETAPDVVVLDLAREDDGGAAACRRIRELASVGDVPLLALSAEQDVSTSVALFEAGADDVVVNSCDPSELLARVHAILRRGLDRRTVRRIGPLRIALATGDAWLSERQLELTNGERSVLVELARAYPGLTARTSLDRRPDQDRVVNSNVTEVLVARLRRKIAAAGGGIEINAVRRSGYVLRPMAITADVP
ncbi:MAG TPA: response regulator transcription factor [Candidatus Limnocylindria bacterium]|jgi:two-component system OmpR family response regulator|nr:response regulator transcription factor [Candidatus Limnocylindria bacterium]